MKKEKLPNGYVRLAPDEGKQLYNTITEQTYSEAVIKETKVWQFKEVNV